MLQMGLDEVTDVQKPAPLSPGDTVAVVAPSSCPSDEPLLRGLSLLESWGLSPHVVKGVGACDDYLGGPDALRAEQLVQALADERYSGVWFARGGYGAVRVLAYLERMAGGLSFPARRPPLMVGFSDISLLLSMASQRGPWACLHGPNVTTLGQLDDVSLQEVRRLVTGGEPLPLTGLTTVASGKGEGPLLVMNLSVLCSVAGTPFAPDLAGRVLVVEDVGESPYRLDRLFMQLSLLPGFSGLAGLAVGDLDGGWESRRLRETVKEIARQAKIPCASGVPAGHRSRHLPLPQGVAALLDADCGCLEIREPLFPS